MTGHHNVCWHCRLHQHVQASCSWHCLWAAGWTLHLIWWAGQHLWCLQGCTYDSATIQLNRLVSIVLRQTLVFYILPKSGWVYLPCWKFWSFFGTIKKKTSLKSTLNKSFFHFLYYIPISVLTPNCTSQMWEFIWITRQKVELKIILWYSSGGAWWPSLIHTMCIRSTFFTFTH